MTTLQKTLITLRDREKELLLWYPKNQSSSEKNASILKMTEKEYLEVCFDNSLKFQLELSQVREIRRNIEKLINK